MKYYPPTSKGNPDQPMRKQWVVATHRSGHTSQKQRNRIMEGSFKQVLHYAKAILATHPQTAFERDQRHDNSQNAFTMHTFMCATLYIELSCDACCNYQVEYKFNQCPHRDEILKLLQVYPLNTEAIEAELLPDFSTYFANVLRFQEAKFIYLLKVG